MDIQKERKCDGKLMRTLRAQADLNGEELARVSSIPLATIRAIEIGRRPIHFIHIVALSVSTGIDAFSFTKGELREWDGVSPYHNSSFEKWQMIKYTVEGVDWQRLLTSNTRAIEEMGELTPRASKGVFAALVGAAFGLALRRMPRDSNLCEEAIIHEMIKSTLNSSQDT